MMLKVERINVFYGEIQVLRDVSLHIEKGEIVTIIGANASGKTTLVNVISGLLKPRSGRIEFLGKEIHRLPPHEIVKLGISQVPEGRHLFSNLTVLENLEMGAFLIRDKDEMASRLERVFQFFPILKERRKQKAGTLSGGEGQMLAIARALMANPKLLILDEPSLGLAPKLVLTTFEIIEKINQKGIGILLVEQNLEHALEVADRGYVLENGRVVLEDVAEKLMNNEHVKKAYLGL